jgi:5-dehydro-2-deoxygluconokinase
VTAHLQRILPKFDLVIGTIEEFNIAGGSTAIMSSLAAIRRVTQAVLVVKRGPLGCAVIDGAIPASLDEAFNGRGVDVAVLNVLGAGDAFSAGFLSGWVRGEDYDACTRYANACGALVVSRHGCAPAMPTRVELDHFIANADRIPRPDQDATLTRLHRVTAPRTPRPEVLAFAFDHRTQLFELAREAGADESRIPRLKALFVDAVEAVERNTGLRGRIGLLCDDHYGQDALNAATGRGWWIGRPVELPGSRPLEFERGALDRHGAHRVAPGARRQVPGRIPSGRPGRAAARAGGAGPHALRRGAGERARAPARDHSAARPAARAGHGAARDEAPLQPRHLPRSGGSSSRWTRASGRRSMR